jgi:hypothetical protein
MDMDPGGLDEVAREMHAGMSLSMDSFVFRRALSNCK